MLHLAREVKNVHVMTNWHLPKQGIRWLASRDQIAASSWMVIEVTRFLKFVADQVLVFD